MMRLVVQFIQQHHWNLCISPELKTIILTSQNWTGCIHARCRMELWECCHTCLTFSVSILFVNGIYSPSAPHSTKRGRWGINNTNKWELYDQKLSCQCEITTILWSLTWRNVEYNSWTFCPCNSWHKRLFLSIHIYWNRPQSFLSCIAIGTSS